MRLFASLPFFRSVAQVLHWVAPPPPPPLPPGPWKPAVKLAREDDCLVASVDLRNVDWSDLEIDATTCRLLVTGKRSPLRFDRRGNPLPADRTAGASFRCVTTFPYPVCTTDMRSEIRGNVLWITFPFQR